MHRVLRKATSLKTLRHCQFNLKTKLYNYHYNMYRPLLVDRRALSWLSAYCLSRQNYGQWLGVALEHHKFLLN